MVLRMTKRFTLYIDDSGSRFPDKQHFVRDDGMDHFALGGILVQENDIEDVVHAHKDFCLRWDINYPLHSTDIRGMRNDFAWLEESSKKKDIFMAELGEFLTSLPVIGFAAVIHRPGYNARYKERYGDERWLLCKTAYCILIERVTKYVEAQGGVFTVRFEGSGKNEDKAIIRYAKALKKEGMPFDGSTSARYGALNHVNYRSVIHGDPRGGTKNNIFLQIADLYLYPMAKNGYDSRYDPWRLLFENKKVINALLSEEEWEFKGVKYSCFEGVVR